MCRSSGSWVSHHSHASWASLPSKNGKDRPLYHIHVDKVGRGSPTERIHSEERVISFYFAKILTLVLDRCYYKRPQPCSYGRGLLPPSVYVSHSRDETTRPPPSISAYKLNGGKALEPGVNSWDYFSHGTCPYGTRFPLLSVQLLHVTKFVMVIAQQCISVLPLFFILLDNIACQ